MTRRPAWLPEALIVAGLVLLPLLFWWRLWALDPADRSVIPDGDFTSQYYPLQLFAARELSAGRLPAWDPYINAGQPGLADIQTGAFYPPNLLLNGVLALLGRPLSLGLLQAQVICHFSLASLFTYLFVRRLARRAGARLHAARLAGAVAALSFTYSGYLTSFPVQQLTILETAVWLPLILFFMDGAAGQSGSRWSVPRASILAGLALACALLAGHPQTALYVAYASLAYGLFLAFSRPNSQLTIEHWALRIVHCLVLPFLLGLAVAAVQLVPALGMIGRSTRAGLDYEALSWGIPLHEITNLLYPGYFGGSPQYLGILPPILAAAAFFVRRARREVVFWLVLGLVALLLAFGGNLFTYPVAYLLAPGFGSVRDQERIVYLFSFAVSVLAGYGALTLVQPLSQPLRRGFRRFGRALGWLLVAFLGLTALWYLGFLQSLQQNVAVNLFEGVLRHHTLLLFILGGSAALFALRRAHCVRRRWLVALALGLVGLNLFTVNWRYNLADPAAEGTFPQTGLVRFLQEQSGAFRISSAGLLPGGSNAGIVYGLEDITANTPLRLEVFQQFEDSVQAWRRWQLLDVHFVLSDRELDGPGLERVYEEGSVKVYQLADALPRAWVVYGVETAAGSQALDRLNAQDFDPRATALVAPGSSLPALSGMSGPGPVAEVVQALPGRLVLQATPEADGLLVISQPFYPGWQARVDGKAVPLHQVDHLLQSVLLSAGPHRVELVYRPPLWPAILSLAALLACTVGLLLRRRRPA